MGFFFNVKNGTRLYRAYWLVRKTARLFLVGRWRVPFLTLKNSELVRHVMLFDLNWSLKTKTFHENYGLLAL